MPLVAAILEYTASPEAKDYNSEDWTPANTKALPHAAVFGNNAARWGRSNQLEAIHTF